jgi:hypothetical protein
MKEQRRDAGLKSAAKRQLNDRSTTVQQRKEKESKVNEIKEEESKVSFNEMLSPFISDLNDEYDNFFSYWTEKDKKGKERWENEKYFDISRRIKTWITNSTKFKSNGTNDNKPLGTSAARMEALRNW